VGYVYKVDSSFLDTQELEDTINYWAEQGYEPHTIVNVKQVRTLSGVQELPVLIVRKLVRKPRKKKVTNEKK